MDNQPAIQLVTKRDLVENNFIAREISVYLDVSQQPHCSPPSSWGHWVTGDPVSGCRCVSLRAATVAAHPPPVPAPPLPPSCPRCSVPRSPPGLLPSAAPLLLSHLLLPLLNGFLLSASRQLPSLHGLHTATAADTGLGHLRLSGSLLAPMMGHGRHQGGLPLAP